MTLVFDYFPETKQLIGECHHGTIKNVRSQLVTLLGRAWGYTGPLQSFITGQYLSYPSYTQPVEHPNMKNIEETNNQTDGKISETQEPGLCAAHLLGADIVKFIETGSLPNDENVNFSLHFTYF